MPAALIWLFILCVSRWLWGLEADRRLAALIADAQARGEPVLPQDFKLPSVPDPENAAILYAQAASALVTTRQFDNLNSINEFDALPPAHSQAIETAIRGNVQILHLVRQASTRPFDNWDFYPSSKHVLNRRNLETYLSWVALYRHQNKDDSEALLIARNLLRLADSFDSGTSPFLDHYLSTYAQEYAINVACAVAYKPTESPANLPTVRSKLNEVINLLLREDRYHRADVRAGYFLREYPVAVMTRSDWESNWDEWLLKPMDEIDGIKTAARFGEEARAYQCLSWPAAESRLPHYEPFEGSALLLVTRFEGRVACTMRRLAARDFFLAATRRRAGAIKIAIRLYQWDHTGQYPRNLKDLIPIYLPSIPQDPMAADGRPLTYHPDDRPPVIYSVGFDGKDDGGLIGSSSRDEVFPLEQPPKKPRPTSRQGEQHQRDQHDRSDHPVTQSK